MRLLRRGTHQNLSQEAARHDARHRPSDQFDSHMLVRCAVDELCDLPGAAAAEELHILVGVPQSRVGGAVPQAGLQAALRHLRCGLHVGVSRAIAALILQSTATRAISGKRCCLSTFSTCLGMTPGAAAPASCLLLVTLLRLGGGRSACKLALIDLKANFQKIQMDESATIWQPYAVQLQIAPVVATPAVCSHARCALMNNVLYKIWKLYFESCANGWRLA